MEIKKITVHRTDSVHCKTCNNKVAYLTSRPGWVCENCQGNEVYGTGPFGSLTDEEVISGNKDLSVKEIKNRILNGYYKQTEKTL